MLILGLSDTKMFSNGLAGMHLILPTLLESFFNHFSDVNLVHQIFPSSIIRKVIYQLMSGFFDVHGVSLASSLGLYNYV